MPVTSRRIIVRTALTAAAVLGLSTACADAETEREQLQRSLQTACKIFIGDEELRWAEADRCRRAWFKTHEEAIWRLKLNPHARPVQAPSS